MAEFAAVLAAPVAPVTVISSADRAAASYGAPTVSMQLAFAGSTLTANLACYIPILVASRVTVTGFGWFNDTTVSGHVDAGIYDEAGTRIVSTGSTLQASISAVQTVSVASTTLNAGNYFLAFAIDNTTGRVRRAAIVVAALEALGVKQQASAFVLPSSATFAVPTSNALPWVAAFLATVF